MLPLNTNTHKGHEGKALKNEHTHTLRGRLIGK